MEWQSQEEEAKEEKESYKVKSASSSSASSDMVATARINCIVFYLLHFPTSIRNREGILPSASKSEVSMRET